MRHLNKSVVLKTFTIHIAKLLHGYTLTIVNNHCLPGAQSVNVLASLDQDISEVIPYLKQCPGWFAMHPEPTLCYF